MIYPDKRRPVRDGARNRAGYFNQLDIDNTTRRELEGLAHRLHACGPRPIFELLRDMIEGRNPADIVAALCGLDPALYAALGALVIDGGVHGQ
jgi:hypothetical protein